MSGMTDWFRQTLLDHLTATTAYTPTGLYMALFTDAAATVELTSPAPDMTDPSNPIFPPGYYRQVVPLPDFDPAATTTSSTSAIEFDIVNDATVLALGLCGSDVVGTADVLSIEVLGTPLVLTSGQTLRYESGTVSLQLI